MSYTKILTIFIFFATLSNSQPTFAQYVDQFDKEYNATQYNTRKALYDARIATFVSITIFTPGVNQFSDWTDSQISKLSGLKLLSSTSAHTPPSTSSSHPSSLNWQTSGKVTPVKNQGSCGSCWAFAAVAYAQSKIVIEGRYDNDVDLAEQKVLKCSQDGSCDGGYLEYGMNSVVDNVPFEQIFSYSPTTNYPLICQFAGVYIGAVTQNYYNLTDQQLIALLQDGPVAIGVSAQGWQDYSAGIFRCGATDPINHAVLLVGYDANAWHIKNSWGNTWGENGFIRVSRLPLLNCQVGKLVSRTFENFMKMAIMLGIVLLGLII